jgi:D-alanyl-lipoteichoic acid acyltransferase DltB (MBOAT superfamily)
MAWGFFKKMVIADTFSLYVNVIFAGADYYQGFPFLLATVMFGFQIYCDFSGYSDIAIGVAKLFDIDLMRNFASPYFAGSIKEFWSRWHISLSTWFRDYVYIPLGGNRCGTWKRRRNLLITFLVSGLWHGAAWNYVIWGFLHGIAQILEDMVVKNRRRSLTKDRSLLTWLSVILVFAFTMVAWFFFRITDMDTALLIAQRAFINIHNPLTYLIQGLRALEMDGLVIFRMLLIVAVLLVYDYFNLKEDVILKISSLPAFARWVIYIGFSMLLLIMLPANKGGEFIYFQF